MALYNKDGSLVDGPFKVIEFSYTEGMEIATPVFRDNPGFISGGKTAGGAREFVIPDQAVDNLVEVSEKVVK